MSKIKLVASDLDRTLLNNEHMLPQRNRDAIQRCIDSGVEFVVATGRVLSSVPDEIRAIEGIRYYITANGANIWDVHEDLEMCSRYLSLEAFESIIPLIEDESHMVEIFTGDRPYVSQASYDDPLSFGIPEASVPYILASRTPVADLRSFGYAHSERIQNVNFIYGSEEGKSYFRDRLVRHDLYELTSAFPFNYEIGGKGVSKASALAFICEHLGVDQRETMGFGDNLNDKSMIEFAGIGVAVGNAVDEAKQAANFVTGSNEEGGVADAIEKFVFDEG
jgi:Cof subfamily protein (haloacid dehalogenase superfamily)